MVHYGLGDATVMVSWGRGLILLVRFGPQRIGLLSVLIAQGQQFMESKPMGLCGAGATVLWVKLVIALSSLNRRQFRLGL
jgi:hypothetical protein